MQGGPGKFVFVILAIFILIDIYAFKGIRQLTTTWNPIVKIVLTVLYWLVPVFMIIMSYYIGQNIGSVTGGKEYYRTFYTFMGVMVLFYVPKLMYVGFEFGNDLFTGVFLILKKLNIVQNGVGTNIIRYSGAVVALSIFFVTIYGIIHGKYHYKVNKIELQYSNLPEEFSGFRIVHITDWHIGSYFGKPKRIQQAVDKINSLNPDLILFTGDMVNNVAVEMDEFKEELKKLSAKHGIYSVLGNHDYGEYVKWESESEAINNLNQLKDSQKEVGFTLLSNKSIPIEKNGDTIRLIGVENWGLPPFPQHGDLDSAMLDVKDSEFKILMSHDPSHWDAEVVPETNIDLTLSGHTHGMQFGINLKNFKWSPVKMKYPHWAGLYSNDKQKLYVSVGIGYIAFPGRVGMRPEIAVLDLVHKN